MNKTIKHSLFILILVAGIFLVAGSAFAAFNLPDWQYSSSIQVPQSGMVKVPLPQDIQWVTSDFSDLRIVDGQIGEVPYILSRNVSSSADLISTRLLNLTNNSSGATSFIVDTGLSGIVYTSLSFQTSSANFRRQVSVYASQDTLPLVSSGWSLVTDKGYVFKFTDPNTRYVSGKDSIDFPANASRYFKVVISSGLEGALTVTSATAQRDISVSTLTYSQEYPVSIFNNPTKKTTEVTIDLGVSGHLTNALTLYPTDANYSRRVVVETSNDASATSSWNYVGQGSISHVSTSVFQGYSNKVDYGEQRARYIRASIVNDDNPPLTLNQKATIEGALLAAIFEAKAGHSYSLYYGNPNARQPQYDITQLSQYIQESSLPLASTGVQVLNSVYVAPKGPVIPFTEANKWLLNILLVVVVLGIGAAIFFYLRAYMKKNGKGTTNFTNTSSGDQSEVQ